MLQRALRILTVSIWVLALSLSSLGQSSGADIFKANCAMCHGNDGLSNIPTAKSLGVRSFKAPDVRKLSNSALAAIIKNGKDRNMPAFGEQLTDAQIKELLRYIHALQKK
jgi:mono/diheme cytochrome c family protein